MAGLLIEKDMSELIERVRSLTERDQAQFGSLSVQSMVAHLIDSFSACYGLKGEFTAEKSFLNTPVGRWFVISSPVPWPKGTIKAPPEIFHASSPSETFEEDKNTLVELMERFRKPSDLKFTESPVFGELSLKQWSKLHYRHLTHHLEQFSR